MAAKKKSHKAPAKHTEYLIQAIAILFFVVSLASLFSILQNIYHVSENMLALFLSLLLLLASAGLWVRKQWGLIIAIVALLLEIYAEIINVVVSAVEYDQIVLKVFGIVFVASIILYLYTKKDLFEN